MLYLIFTKAPINLNKTYYQNSRRGEKCHKINGKDAMLKKVDELKSQGEKILSIRTALGGWVNI